MIRVRDYLNKIGIGTWGRFYQVHYDSTRNTSPEQGVVISEFDHKWYFDDTKLGFPIKVHLHERVERGRGNLNAIVIFQHTDRRRIEQVDEYVKRQLEQVANDGMVKL